MMMKELLALARSNNLSSYDASYLALAMRKGVPIATLNNRLIKAAERIDVPILVA
jgi:predicted nucleic acid-binding protein